MSEHLDNLLTNTTDRYKQVTLESVNFVADLISATNKQNSEKINRYFQTGDPEDLGSLQILSLKGYKEAVELFQKLTGTDKIQKVGGEITVNHKATPNTLPTSEEAADILKQLLGKK